VRLRFHLTPLSEEDTRAYVLHRLEIAGAAGRTIFADSCFPLLFRYTGGVPRLVNTLCETAMMAAFGEDRDRITPGDLRKAIAELRWVDYATRTATQRNMIEGHAPTTADIGTTGSRQGPGLYVPAGDDDEILARLVVARDDEIVGELPLRMGRTVVGRTSDNDLQIDSRLVSRHHCQIVTSRDQSVVEDLNSTNGTYINGKAVKKQMLVHNDTVEVGKYKIKYHADQGAGYEATQILRPGAAASAPSAPSLSRPSGFGGPTSLDPLVHSPATIRVLNGAAAGREVSLVKVVTTIGKPGVQVASITKRPAGYVLAHVEGAARPTVNGKPLVTETLQLHDGDVVELAGTQMQFINR
jgi:pSer/pThr/pTyr-binding forkhead associated (FHA) protein